MIVYGWNTYRLKSVSPQELGLGLTSNVNYTIEYRQRYAHVFFIPIFPVGRFWTVKENGQMYQPTDELKQQLQSHKSAGKHALWAWTGPLIGLLIYLLVGASEKMEASRNHKRIEEQKSVLTAYFHDSSKVAPLRHKLFIMESLIDTAITQVKYESTDIDTTSDAMTLQYLEALATRADSLTGYTPQNTLVIVNFSRETERRSIIDEDYKKSLIEGEWKGYSDTSSVFNELRNLEDYKYILVLTEYNRLDPEVVEKNYNSGYLFALGNLLSIDSAKSIKTFKIMASNSEQVSQYTYKSSSESTKAEGLRNLLRNDLEKNARKEGEGYVFGQFFN